LFLKKKKNLCKCYFYSWCWSCYWWNLFRYVERLYNRFV